MKNIIIVLMLVIVTGLSAHSQSIKVPEPVKSAFHTRYPAATNVKWGKENAKEFEAEFKLGNNTVSANFGLDGTWVETESVIPVSELPAAVKAAVTAKYPGSMISLAEKTEQPGNKVLYEVSVKVKGKTKSMELNPDGTPGK